MPIIHNSYKNIKLDLKNKHSESLTMAQTSVAVLLVLAAIGQITITAGQLPTCPTPNPKIIHTMKALKGDIYSPGNDKGANYEPNQYCTHTLLAPPGFRLLLTFVALDLDVSERCKNDAVEIYEGTDSQGTLIASLCGQLLKPHPILSRTNNVHVVFRSDFSNGRKGFHVKYETTVAEGLCAKGQIQCRNRNCVDVGYVCNGKDDCKDGTDEENCGPSQGYRCGLRPGQDRIAGGSESAPGSWPWLASLQLAAYEPSGHLCGGVLVSPGHVLTAARCFRGFKNTADYRVHLGKFNKYKTDAEEQVRYVRKIFITPNYVLEGEQGAQWLQEADMEHGLALVRLNAFVNMTDHVLPACYSDIVEMPSSGCSTAGWGLTKGTGGSDVLKEIDLSATPLDQCDSDIKLNKDTMVCTTKTNGNEDVCQGDFGGPLSCKVAARWYVFGVAGFGSRIDQQAEICGVPGSHTVFVRVPNMAFWIDTMRHS